MHGKPQSLETRYHRLGIQQNLSGSDMVSDHSNKLCEQTIILFLHGCSRSSTLIAAVEAVKHREQRLRVASSVGNTSDTGLKVVLGNAVGLGLRAVVASAGSVEFRTAVVVIFLGVVNLAAEDNATSIGSVKVWRKFNAAVRVRGTASGRDRACFGSGSNDSNGQTVLAGVGLAAA